MTRLQQRIVLTMTAAIAGAVVSWNLPPYASGATTDFAWVWSGARAWLAGLDPYASVGPGRLYEFWSALWYPLPALVVGVPFALVSLPMANALFVAMSTALLMWGLTRNAGDEPKLILFCSFAWLSAVQNAQWSPLVTAAALTPSFGFLLACKPTVGAALLCAYPSRRAIVGVLLVGLLTMVLWPWWVSSWLAATATSIHTFPVMRWGGPFVLLALFKWRRPEARLLAALACVPQTASLYEAVPLFLLVTTWTEGVGLTVLCAIVYFGVQRQTGDYPDLASYLLAVQQWMVCLLYIPCTLLVLRRPNEGAFSWPLEWVSRWAALTKRRLAIVEDA